MSKYLILLPICFLLLRCSNPDQQSSESESFPNMDSGPEPIENSMGEFQQGSAEEEGWPAAEGEEPNSMDSKWNTTHGTFTEIQVGDYLHFKMEDDSGRDLSFWIDPDMTPAELDPFLNFDYPTGTKVEVFWKTVLRHIPEAGSEMELDEIQKINVLD